MKTYFTQRQTDFISHAIDAHLDASQRGYGSLWWGNSDEEEENSEPVENMLRDGWSIPEMVNEDSASLRYIQFALQEYANLRDDGLAKSSFTRHADERRLTDAIIAKIQSALQTSNPAAEAAECRIL